MTYHFKTILQISQLLLKHSNDMTESFLCCQFVIFHQHLPLQYVSRLNKPISLYFRLEISPAGDIFYFN